MTDTAPSWTRQARATPAFAGVAPGDVGRLVSTATMFLIPDGQAIFARGDPANTVYITLSGSVRISTMAASGKQMTVEIFQRDDLFGEIAAIDHGVRTADATAMGPVELVSIPASVFREVLQSSAPLANNLLRVASERLRRTYSLLEDASLRTIEQRLARQVLYLVKLGASGQGRVRLRVRMHQDELADLLGVTTRTIINVLNKWRADELVSFDGRAAQLTILDIDRFRTVTEEPLQEPQSLKPP